MNSRQNSKSKSEEQNRAEDRSAPDFFQDDNQVEGGAMTGVKCERCGRLVEAIVLRNAAAMSLDEAEDYGEKLGVVYDDFEGYCECDGGGDQALVEGEGESSTEVSEMGAWFALDARVVEAGLNNPANARHGVVVSDEVFDDGVECFVEVLWDGETEPQTMCLGHMNPEPDEPCDCCQRGPCVCEDGGCEHCGPEPFEELYSARQERIAKLVEQDRKASRPATRWDWIVELGDIVLAEDTDPFDNIYSQMVRGWSEEKRSAFWSAYFEYIGDERPDGFHMRDRVVPAYGETLKLVDGEFEVVPQRIDDTEPSRRWNGKRFVDFGERVGSMSTTFARALDAEWDARRPVVKATLRRGVPQAPPMYEEDKAMGVIEEFVATELNRLVAEEQQRVIEERRAEETLIVVDRRKVVLVPPRVARTLEAEWDVERAAWRLAPVKAENKSWWFEQGAEHAEHFAESLVERLIARGAPCRTWRPDNRSPRARQVDAFRWAKQQRRREVDVASPETYRFARWSEGRLAEVLEELDNVNEEVAA